MERKNILTGSPWEDKMGYCRAVRIGNIIEVSGTVAIVDGEKVKADDAQAQTLNILERVEKVLEELKFDIDTFLLELNFKINSTDSIFLASNIQVFIVVYLHINSNISTDVKYL